MKGQPPACRIVVAVVTPTGLDIDADGGIWVVACRTHFRPTGYEGPEHDEVLVMGRDGTRRVFAARTTATMNLLLGPEQRARPGGGWVYLAERSRILRIRDGDGDGTADVEETIAVLDTVTDYPHNGLAGLAWHPDGDLYFVDWVFGSYALHGRGRLWPLSIDPAADRLVAAWPPGRRRTTRLAAGGRCGSSRSPPRTAPSRRSPAGRSSPSSVPPRRRERWTPVTWTPVNRAENAPRDRSGRWT